MKLTLIMFFDWSYWKCSPYRSFFWCYVRCVTNRFHYLPFSFDNQKQRKLSVGSTSSGPDTTLDTSTTEKKKKKKRKKDGDEGDATEKIAPQATDENGSEKKEKKKKKKKDKDKEAEE